MNTNRTATANEIKETRAMIAAIMTTARRVFTYRKINKEAGDVLGTMLQGAHTAIENTNDRPELVELYRMQANELAQMLQELNRPDDMDENTAKALNDLAARVESIGQDVKATNCKEIGNRIANAVTYDDTHAAIDELVKIADDFADMSSACTWIAGDIDELARGGDVKGEQKNAALFGMVLALVGFVYEMMAKIENARGKYEGGPELLGLLECVRDDLEYITDIANKMAAEMDPDTANRAANSSSWVYLKGQAAQRTTTKAPAVYIAGNVLNVTTPRNDCKRYDLRTSWTLN